VRIAVALALIPAVVTASSVPISGLEAMVVSQEARASDAGLAVMRAGGNAIDAAVTTAFVLAVTHPAAGNIGGGGFLVYRPASGPPVAYDFRETAPSSLKSAPWLVNGEYLRERHHEGHAAVGVPGTVAGLYLAWKDHGELPWERLLEPAITLARGGFEVSHGLARSLKDALPRMSPYPASIAQFTRDQHPYVAGGILRQPDLAATLSRIAINGPKGFYEGKTAELIVKEMAAHSGFIGLEDLQAYRAKRREPIVGSYRGYEVISMPPPSSGGVVLVEMLNILEGVDRGPEGFGSARHLHCMIEAMRRAYADRAQHLGDSDFNPTLPLARLTSKDYASQLRSTIDPNRASVSSPDTFSWPKESEETTHLSVVDSERNAVALTTTLEYSYGSGIVVPGGGFLLNNEMGDFNAGPGLTTTDGLIGTVPNQLEAGKRMLSSMTPTVVARNGRLVMVTGSPGGRTIINTVMQTILNVVDYGMNAQQAVDAGRIHHAWLPDAVHYERYGFSFDTLEILRAMGHRLIPVHRQGAAEVILLRHDEDVLEGGLDRRATDGGVAAD
jgi:gamma-glutamyltranspeptidase/glutathione hydrolase